MIRAACALFPLALCLLSPASSLAAKTPEVVELMPKGDLGDGFGAVGAPEHFAGQKLFDYMDGGAELYLAFGFVDLAVGEYKKGDLPLRLALYRMGSPAEAYGIWSFAASGKQVGLAGPHALAPNMLSFFRGKYYVRVLSQKVSPESAAAMTALGKKVFAALPGEAKVPPEVAKLPPGAIAATLRYLTHPETGRTVWFDGEAKLLLSDGARAVTATYPGDDDDVQITRAVYPKAEAAIAACQALAKKLGLTPALEGGRCRAGGKTPDDVFARIATDGDVLRWVSGPADQAGADVWLKKIQ